MASDHSLYRKIELVLDMAKSVSVANLDELRSEIIGRKPANFFSRQYDPETDRFDEDISERAVRKTLSTCRVLGLLADDGSLTTAGREALRKTRFDAVLAAAVRRFFREREIHLSKLNEQIREKLQASPPVLPTSEELWRTTGAQMSRGTFARMLTLLAHSGAARSAQRRIYLRFEAG